MRSRSTLDLLSGLPQGFCAALFERGRAALMVTLLLLTSATAQPQTPTVYLNEKIRLAQVAVGQRATLRYDLRAIGGQNLLVKLFHHTQTLEDTPVREWILTKAAGSDRLDFRDLPRGVYTIWAAACDPAGQPLALPAPYVSVEYGGWRGWEAFKPPVETVTEAPPAFNDVDVATNTTNRDMRIGVDPSAVVVRPGGEVPLKAGFAGMEPERLIWKLEGPGELKAVDEFHYTYKAPAEQLGSKMVRVELKSVAHPELTATALILVTNADPETLNSLEP